VSACVAVEWLQRVPRDVVGAAASGRGAGAGEEAKGGAVAGVGWGGDRGAVGAAESGRGPWWGGVLLGGVPALLGWLDFLLQ